MAATLMIGFVAFMAVVLVIAIGLPLFGHRQDKREAENAGEE
jgi:hypothetical protein